MDLDISRTLQLRDRRRFLAQLAAASGAITSLALPSLAQNLAAVDPNETAIFRTAVRVVNILATVRDKTGKIIQGLTKDDFILEEQGHAQEIRYFTQQSDLPITIGLLIDVSGSLAALIEEEKTVTLEFVNAVLREQDLGFLIVFAGTVLMEQRPTSSLAELSRSIARLRFPPFGGTQIYDAVVMAADDVLKAREGRKVIIVLSDGEDNSSRASLTHAVEAAQRADSLVYTFQIGPLGPSRWERLSTETGGRYFKNGSSLPAAFSEIRKELRNQYSLGFEPKAAAAGFRSLKLSTKDKASKVQARTRYYYEP
ncbi:MAG: VWA domain-containing protein [Acidobacteriota bacterium]